MSRTVSIVIPTYHRKDSLLRLLASLAADIDKKTEVIVVEQGENNGRAYQAFAKKNSLHLLYFPLTSPSTPKAMNLGVAKAHGEFVVFLDDDVTVHKGFIQHHRANFTDPNVAATVGKVITKGQEEESLRTDTGRINWLGNFSDGFSSNIKQEVDTVIGANTCWRKDVYVQLGGMDERFTGNALRLESDLSLRAKKAGYKIIFEPKAVVDHHRAETGGARKSEGRLRWYFDFFSNETYFFLKHRPADLLPIFLLTKTNWALKCMFGFGREVSMRSFVTPFAGIRDGVRKYISYDHRR